MPADDINALLAAGSGRAMLEGAQAGYYTGKGRLEAAEEQRRQDVQGDIPAAIKGDTAAFGRVAAGDYKTAAGISSMLSRMDANQRAKVKEAADWDVKSSNAVLQSDPKDQPAAYARMLEEGRLAGHDLSRMPQTWDASVPAILRYHRGLGIDVNKQDALTTRIQIHNTPNKGGSSVMVAPPSWERGGKPTAMPVEPADRESSATPDIQPPVVADAAPPMDPTAPPPGVASASAPAVLASQGAPVAPPAGPPAGFRAMGVRDAQGNLIPANLGGKPVYSHPQTGDMWHEDLTPDGAPIAQGDTPNVSPGMPPPSAQPVGPIAAPPQGAPPVQMAQAQTRAPTPAAPSVFVHEVPPGYEPFYDAATGSPIVNKQGLIPLRAQGKPGLLLKPADQKPEKAPFPTGYEADPAKPGALRAIAGGPADLTRKQVQVGITDANKDLRGEDFINTLPAGDQDIDRKLLDGSLTLGDLTKRGADYTRYLAQVSHADPNFDPGPAYSRRAFESKFMVNGQGGTTMLAANTASDHMKTYYDLMQGLGNGDMRMVNAAVNAVRRQFGDGAATSPEVAKTVLATEIAKAVRGAGALNEQEQLDYQKLLATANGPGAARDNLNTLSGLMMGRVHAIEDMARSKGIPDSQANSYFSPRARAALDYIKANPSAKPTPGIMDQIGGLFKGGSAAPAGRPPLGSFQR